MKNILLIGSLIFLFAMGFALAALILDDDEDGVPNDQDLCPDTPLGTEVDEFGCPIDSGDEPTEPTYEELLEAVKANCALNVKNHGQYVSCVAKDSKEIIIENTNHGVIVSEAAQSDIGMPNA
jgi:hypothetical protein